MAILISVLLDDSALVWNLFNSERTMDPNSESIQLNIFMIYLFYDCNRKWHFRNCWRYIAKQIFTNFWVSNQRVKWISKQRNAHYLKTGTKLNYLEETGSDGFCRWKNWCGQKYLLFSNASNVCLNWVRSW